MPGFWLFDSPIASIDFWNWSQYYDIELAIFDKVNYIDI